MSAASAADPHRFAELTNTPVMTNAEARGSISEEHPLCFGAIHPVCGESLIFAESAIRHTQLKPTEGSVIFAQRKSSARSPA